MNSDVERALGDSYRFCEKVTARHGRTYYLAARLLPPARQRAVHALYAFARIVDDVVDEPGDARRLADPGAGAAALTDIADVTFRALSTNDHRGPYPATVPADLVRALPAFADAVDSFTIPHAYFRAFFDSMRMDAPGASEYRPVYSTMTELRQYMYGSAAVIGLQMLPVLGVTVPLDEAAVPASYLGEAFQLTNFIRDVGEDLDRGRLYLPAEDFAAFGVDTGRLEHGRRTGSVDVRVQRALAHFVAVTRSLYRDADEGIAMLDPRVRPSIRAAFVLYGAILDEVENAGFQILDRRVTVPQRTRLRVAGPGLVRAAAHARLHPSR